MGFVGNVLEDWENFLVETLSDKKVKQLQQQEAKLIALKESLDYRKTDLIYLVQEGFSFNQRRDEWSKVEKFDYGRYPGEYEIKIKFPDDYPRSIPNIWVNPLGNIEYSYHIKAGHRGEVCLEANRWHGHFWRNNMNAKGALALTRHLITGELENPTAAKTEVKKEEKAKIAEVKKTEQTGVPKARKTLKIEGTIFEEISKLVRKEDFVQEWEDIDNSWTWEEIAYDFSKAKINDKKELAEYYQEVKQNG